MKDIDDKPSFPSKGLAFAKRLQTKWLGKQIIFHRELASTQDEAKKHIFSAPSGLVIWADRQTRGRGRLSRSWLSPRGAGLYFSVLLKEPLAHPLPLYGLATALGVATALEEILHVPCFVKWPNDVLLCGKKVAGILLESFEKSLIIGIGINVSFKKEDFPPDLRKKATSIYLETGIRLSRARILRSVLKELEILYEKILQKGFPAIEDLWRAKDVAAGSRVILKRGEQLIKGLALGPASDGTLLLKTSTGLMHVHSGEILMWEISGWENPRAA